MKPEFSKAHSSYVLLILVQTGDRVLSWPERQEDKNRSRGTSEKMGAEKITGRFWDKARCL